MATIRDYTHIGLRGSGDTNYFPLPPDIYNFPRKSYQVSEVMSWLNHLGREDSLATATILILLLPSGLKNPVI